MKPLPIKLSEINAIQFGSFTLKSGLLSPFYVDLRLTISYPEIIKEIARLMHEEMRHLSFDLIAGVPYTALPFATALSLMHTIPMVMNRKEVKDYGTKKKVEGVFKEGDTCLIIEDIITSGSSILDTASSLRSCGLIVTDALVLINREQGGDQRLKENGITLHSVYTMRSIIQTLLKENKMDTAHAEKALAFIEKVKT